MKTELLPVVETGAKCDTCFLHESEGPVFGQLTHTQHDKPYDILLVQEKPRHNEFRAKKPFAGNSGRLLYRLLKEFDWDERDLLTTTATLCAKHEYITDRDWNRAINNCSARLLHDIRRAKRPGRKLLVLLCGKKALYAVSHHSAVVGKRGKRGYPLAECVYSGTDIEKLVQTEEVILFPMLSPDEVRAFPPYLPVWKTDLSRAINYAEGKLGLWRWPHIVTGLNGETFALLEQVARGFYPVFAGDTETAGIEPLIAPLICTGIATRDFSICFPHGRDSEFDKTLNYILKNPGLTFVAQNINHDWTELEAKGYGPILCEPWDILNATRTRLPWLEADLQNVASYFYFIDKWKQVYASDKGDEGWEVALHDETALEKMMGYCARDAYGTLICVEPLDRLLEEPL